jgi:hypothetical protein
MATNTTPDEFALLDSRNAFAWNLLTELRERSTKPEVVESSDILLANLSDPTDYAVVVWANAEDIRSLDETAWGVDERGHWSDCYEAPLVWCDLQDDHSLIVWYSAKYGERGSD